MCCARSGCIEESEEGRAVRRASRVRGAADDGRGRHGRQHRSGDRRVGGALAARAHERRGPADPSARDLRVSSRGRHARRASSSTRRWSWPAPSAETTRCASSTAFSTRFAAASDANDHSRRIRSGRAAAGEPRRAAQARGCGLPAPLRCARVDRRDRAHPRRQDRRSARCRASHNPDGRANPGDSQLRQGELPGAVRRQVAHSGVHPGGFAVRRAISRSSGCSTSATGSASKDVCSAPRRRNSRSGRRSSNSSRSVCCRCQKSGTASPTSRRATGSAISI